MKTKTIKLIKRDGSVILKCEGDNLKVLELATCCKHDVICIYGDVVEIKVSA
ncbi:hypothetical protein [Paenibacillus tianjinensis]|uniref:Uncharacterized protein n=1 Tax=Paenibacillus tianjinensis TaxID=2810347 RepID=A0ABX7L801_9BACL|nr:hypothetical protein [Paenibacillus tianjinensis]QSF43503.1 hypothetical protein JRJ22_19770 [Paenibacillus tianjinensis]